MASLALKRGKGVASVVADAETEIEREVPAADSPFEMREGRRIFPRLGMKDDGSLSKEKAEKFCLGLVEGLVSTEAWRAAGGVNSGSDAIAERRAYEADPVFQARWERLTWERRADLMSGPHGEAMQAARMAFRTARVAGDAAQVLRAAELMARIADRMAPVAEPGSVEARGPGRPPQEPAQSKVNVSLIRQGLLEKGLPAPADAG